LSVPAEWPGEGHRRPKRSWVTYAVRKHLSAWLEQEAQRAAADFGRYRVLDIGCGKKPYYPYFAPNAIAYVGVDIDVENPMADLVGPVEDLPVEDGSFDVVICTQVLEHTGDPDQAVSELYRATAPGGRVLASTHGVQVYHPSPVDYWRWTHEGLRRLFEQSLFEQNTGWSALRVEAAAGTASALAMLLGIYVEIALRRTALARGPVSLLNRAGSALDARSASLRQPVPGSLIPNYHVIADV
jgi:SAM-dependent methyltransferase